MNTWYQVNKCILYIPSVFVFRNTMHSLISYIHTSLHKWAFGPPAFVIAYLISSPASGTFSLKKRKSCVSSKSLCLSTFPSRDLNKLSTRLDAESVLDASQPDEGGW